MRDKVCYTSHRHTLESSCIHTGVLSLPQVADVPLSTSLPDMAEHESGKAHWKLISTCTLAQGCPMLKDLAGQLGRHWRHVAGTVGVWHSVPRAGGISTNPPTAQLSP